MLRDGQTTGCVRLQVRRPVRGYPARDPKAQPTAVSEAAPQQRDRSAAPLTPLPSLPGETVRLEPGSVNLLELAESDEEHRRQLEALVTTAIRERNDRSREERITSELRQNYLTWLGRTFQPLDRCPPRDPLRRARRHAQRRD
jgi:hypothetical protein